MIKPGDLTGIEDSTARRVISYARTIVPCLDTLADGTGDEPMPRSDAIAILMGVAREVAARGARHVQSQRVGAASVAYFDVKSCFSPDDRSALRALCGPAEPPGLPVGSFPPAGVVSRMWPEGC